MGLNIRFRSITGSALAAVGLVAGLTGTAVLVAPAAAHAASAVSVSGSLLRADAEAGKANRFRLALTNTTIQVSDAGDVLTAGAGCVSITRNLAECDATSVTRIQINTGDGDDAVESLVLLDTTVNAGAGDDRVVTSGRVDTLSGGAGADALDGGAGDDTLNGGADADVLTGGAGRDALDGGTGPDVFNGGADRDTASYDSRTVGVVVDLDGVADDGEPGELDNVLPDVEKVSGGSGPDRLTGPAVPASVAITLDGNQGSDTLVGLTGQDDLVGNEGDDVMSGGDGPDDFFPGPGRDTMSGGTGDDEAFYSERTARVEVSLDGVANDGEVGEQDNVGVDVEDVSTGSGPDKIVGNAADNAFNSNGGVDFIDAQGGADFLGGGTENDTLRGGDGDDSLQGGPGADTLEGGRHNDLLNGNDGDDTLSGGVLGAGNDGRDRFIGDLGFDTVDYTDHGGISVTASLDGVANDGATGLNEQDNLDFGVEVVIGGSGPDVLIGDDNANRLIGGLTAADAGDLLIGNGGNDELFGVAGNDTLNCGAGPADLGDGGVGVDTVQIGHGCETLVNVP